MEIEGNPSKKVLLKIKATGHRYCRHGDIGHGTDRESRQSLHKFPFPGREGFLRWTGGLPVAASAVSIAVAAGGIGVLFVNMI